MVLAALKDKLEYIYSEYRELMLNKAYGIVKDRKLAEEALYNAFVHIGKNIASIGDPGSSHAVAFVVTIAKSCAFSLAGGQPREALVARGGRDFSIKGVEDALYEMSASDIIKIVNRLGGVNKNIFLLKYAYGMPVRKISQILGDTEANIEIRLNRAQKKLCGILAEGGR